LIENSKRTVYLMVKDIEGGEAGIDWGVDWGLRTGESLPADIEDLSLAQYTVWKLVRAIKGIGDKDFKTETEAYAKERPTGILMPGPDTRQ